MGIDPKKVFFPFGFWNESELHGKCCRVKHPAAMTCEEAVLRMKDGVELLMAQDGWDFESHAEKRVKYRGSDDALSKKVPVGTLGTIKATHKGKCEHVHCLVEWDFPEPPLPELKRMLRKFASRAEKFVKNPEGPSPAEDPDIRIPGTSDEHHWSELEFLPTEPEG